MRYAVYRCRSSQDRPKSGRLASINTGVFTSDDQGADPEKSIEVHASNGKITINLGRVCPECCRTLKYSFLTYLRAKQGEQIYMVSFADNGKTQVGIKEEEGEYLVT